jgi:hypothetical protein
MKIGIDINGVLRDTIGKFKTTYEKFLIDNNLENSESENPFEYVINEPIDSLDLMNHFSFQSKEEFFSFLYEEFPMEIFGHSPSTELLSFNYLNDFYLDFRDKNDIVIISDEIGKTKPATLFFLSKFGCLIESILFYNDSNRSKVLGDFDLIVTSNPDILINYNNCIKFNTIYNEKINCNESINSIEKLKLILKNKLNADNS